MTPKVVTAGVDNSLMDAATSMILGKFRHLPVIADKGSNTISNL
jgi:CBS domain-containing protein